MVSRSPSVRVLALLLLGACGGSGPAEPQPDLTQSTALTRPVAPARLFPDGLAAQKRSYDDLRKRLDPGPAGDAWSTEFVAERCEAALRLLFEQASTGGVAQLTGMTARGFEGGVRLLPTDWTDGGARGALSIRRGTGVGPLTAEEAPEAFAELLGGFLPGSSSLEVHCVRCDEVEPTLFRTRVLLRITGSVSGDARVQRSASVDLSWKVARRFLLQAVHASEVEEATESSRTFRGVTRGLLAGTTLDGQENLEGAVEHTRRMDVQVAASAVALGMHGIGVGDLNGDGLEDLYIGRHAGEPNHYLLRTPSGGYVDAPAGHGADLLEDTCGVLVADLDGDGARDLALAVFSKVVLLWNDGSGRFPEHTLLESEGGAQVYTIVAGDTDGDGDLDLYDTRYHRGDHEASPPLPYHDARNGASNHFWRQTGRRTFEDATSEVGLNEGNDRYSLAALFEDLDADGDLDLYVTNDFGRNNYYRNVAGRFSDIAEMAGGLDMAAGMGVSVADVNRDGVLDLYVSNMWSAPGTRVTAQDRFMARHPASVRGLYGHHAAGNTLLLGAKDGSLRDASRSAGLSPGGWSWGSILFDWNNDGYSDAFVPNGFTTMWTGREAASYFWRVVVESSPASPPLTGDYQRNWQFLTHLGQVEGWSLAGAEANRAYLNLGGEFADVSGAVGLDHVEDGRSAVTLDLDGDGHLDLITKNRTAPLVRAFHNLGQGAGQWIGFELVGRSPNTEAIGARVMVRAGGRELLRTVHAGEGYLASPSKRLHFGLGDDAFDSVQIRWPWGETTTHEGLDPGRWHRIGPEGPLGLASFPSEMPAAGAELPVSQGPFRARVPLLATLPWAGWRLPSFDGQEAVITGQTDGALAVVVWAGWDDASRQLLRDLASSRGEWASTGARVVPLSLDEPQAQAWVEQDVRGSGLPEVGGRADTRTRVLVESLVTLSTGPQEDLRLPLVFVFDRTGRLAITHLGPTVSGSQVVEDLRSIGDQALGRVPEAIQGGRWLFFDPRRPVQAIADYLERHGEADLAASLRQDL